VAQRLEAAAVISRAERILFMGMLIAAVIMAAILIRLRERAQDRLHALQTSTPLAEAVEALPTAVTLLIPNDADNSLQESQRSLPLPHDESARAHVLLETLLESFREPSSTHPIAGAGGSSSARGLDVDEVFLMPLPQARDGAPNPGKMAVVNFSTAFAQSHPSGIEPETLTLLSIIGTLHANLPAITQVRFLVDGHPRDTLAGHADLTRVYLASSTDSEGGR
jgi:hypothetical protein